MRSQWLSKEGCYKWFCTEGALRLRKVNSPMSLMSQPGIILRSVLCMHAQLSQLCWTLCNPMNHSMPGSSVYGILQARILESVAISSSRGSFWPRDWTQVSCIAGRFFTVWATSEAPLLTIGIFKCFTYLCVIFDSLCFSRNLSISFVLCYLLTYSCS